MKLLTEIYEPLGLITEGEGVERKHYLQGLRLEFDNPNKNGRIYRSNIHDLAVHEYITEKMNPGRGWGELDHPDGATINLKNVCQRMIEMHKEGNNWHGKSIIADEHPVGKMVLGLLKTGGTLGSSSRGVGTVKALDEAVLEVQDDFKLITPSDIVSDPSAHGALMAGIMEGVEYFWDDVLGPISEDAKKKINKMSLKEIEEKKILVFENFLKQISKA